MRNKFFLLSLISVMFFIFAFIPVTPVRAASYTNVTVQEAYAMINNNTQYPNLLILDVREKYEYDESHLYNSTLIPRGQIDTRISALLPYNETEILVYCRTGSRSAMASQNLAGNHNFTKIFNLLGGITDWIAAGYPIWTPDIGQDPPDNLTPSIDFSLNFFLIILFGIIGLILIYYKKRKLVG